jgi:hypothetical protein
MGRKILVEEDRKATLSIAGTTALIKKLDKFAQSIGKSRSEAGAFILESYFLNGVLVPNQQTPQNSEYSDKGDFDD